MHSTPWEKIKETLAYYQFPQYLQEVMQDYLRGRDLTYKDRTGSLCGREVYCRVPQGSLSVLGPLLWNFAYDRVLRTTLLPPGAKVVCYTDNALVLARGETWGEASGAANYVVARVMISIVGLRVAPHKIIYFNDGTRGTPPRTHVLVDEIQVGVSRQIKYLALTLDGTWCFVPHFVQLVSRLKSVASSLGRLLLNLGDLRGRVRRLYAEVVLRGAIWRACMAYGDGGHQATARTLAQTATHGDNPGN